MYISLRKPSTVSYILMVLFSTLSLTQIIALLLGNVDPETPRVFEILAMGVAVVLMVIVLTSPFRDPETQDEDISQPFSNPSSDLRSPEDNITPWQFMTVSWMAPLISVGSSRQINEPDVWQLPYQFQHRRLHALFRELPGSITRRLLAANGLDLIITTALGIFESFASMSLDNVASLTILRL